MISQYVGAGTVAFADMQFNKKRDSETEESKEKKKREKDKELPPQLLATLRKKAFDKVDTQARQRAVENIKVCPLDYLNLSVYFLWITLSLIFFGLRPT